MSIVLCDEDEPTLGEVKLEISNIVGLSEIKSQLEDIVDKITDAERDSVDGFVGNNGTGGVTCYTP